MGTWLSQCECRKVENFIGAVKLAVLALERGETIIIDSLRVAKTARARKLEDDIDLWYCWRLCFSGYRLDASWRSIFSCVVISVSAASYGALLF